jgi:hypothetical protein
MSLSCLYKLRVDSEKGYAEHDQDLDKAQRKLDNV